MRENDAGHTHTTNSFLSQNPIRKERNHLCTKIIATEKSRLVSTSPAPYTTSSTHTAARTQPLPPVPSPPAPAYKPSPSSPTAGNNTRKQVIHTNIAYQQQNLSSSPTPKQQQTQPLIMSASSSTATPPPPTHLITQVQQGAAPAAPIPPINRGTVYISH